MATLTHRKLIRFGGGIAVTLPKGWVDYYQLKPGDKVAVTTNKKLVVRPVEKDTKRRCEETQ